MDDTLSSCMEEWKELENDYEQLDIEHRSYCRKVQDVKASQRKCINSIAHQRHRSKHIADSIKKLQKRCTDPTEKSALEKLKEDIDGRKKHFRDLEDVLPHENGIYLKVVLGSVNVSLLSKNDKYTYKEDYEQFKLRVNLITLVLGCILWPLPYRVMDALYQFLLVWYFCTLTIREHILRVNGSRIKGWWITHHFVSTACAGIVLIWPDSHTYDQFRDQFFVFSIYITVVQLVKYYYQSGCLYRLRALGEKRDMDITVEGFQSFMWKGLSSVLPFLVVGYLFQLYNAYVLYRLSQHKLCKEWQVYVLSFIFLMLFLGNSMTLAAVIRQKVKKKASQLYLENKYRFNHKKD